MNIKILIIGRKSLIANFLKKELSKLYSVSLKNFKEILLYKKIDNFNFIINCSSHNWCWCLRSIFSCEWIHHFIVSFVNTGNQLDDSCKAFQWRICAGVRLPHSRLCGHRRIQRWLRWTRQHVRTYELRGECSLYSCFY